MLRAACLPGARAETPRAIRAIDPSMPTSQDAAVDRRNDLERRAMVDVALTLAELDANWGDYDYAIEYLDAANELTNGSLAPRWAARRRRWLYAARGYTR